MWRAPKGRGWIFPKDGVETFGLIIPRAGSLVQIQAPQPIYPVLIGRVFVVEGYQVYVIQNSEGRFYIGLSENVETRLIQHRICLVPYFFVFQSYPPGSQMGPITLTESGPDKRLLY